MMKFNLIVVLLVEKKLNLWMDIGQLLLVTKIKFINLSPKIMKKNLVSTKSWKCTLIM